MRHLDAIVGQVVISVQHREHLPRPCFETLCVICSECRPNPWNPNQGKADTKKTLVKQKWFLGASQKSFPRKSKLSRKNDVDSHNAVLRMQENTRKVPRSTSQKAVVLIEMVRCGSLCLRLHKTFERRLPLAAWRKQANNQRLSGR